MATNLDVITTALRLANVINERETPSAVQGQTGLELLNDLMSDWLEDGIELGYYPQTLTSATIPVDDEYLRGIKYNLSRDIAAHYGVDLPPETVRIAELTYQRLSKQTMEDFTTDFSHMPYGSGRGIYDVNVE